MRKRLPHLICLLLFLSVIVTESDAAVADEQATLAPPVEVGQSAPSFELPALDGSTRSLESLRGESGLVLIFFRGAW